MEEPTGIDMSAILELTSITGQKISIVVQKITGITETSPQAAASYGNCFIATGADGADGDENGWYVSEDYDVVKIMLEESLEN